jgi:hypothetical protein
MSPRRTTNPTIIAYCCYKQWQELLRNRTAIGWTWCGRGQGKCWARWHWVNRCPARWWSARPQSSRCRSCRGRFWFRRGSKTVEIRLSRQQWINWNSTRTAMRLKITNLEVRDCWMRERIVGMVIEGSFIVGVLYFTISIYKEKMTLHWCSQLRPWCGWFWESNPDSLLVFSSMGKQNGQQSVISLFWFALLRVFLSALPASLLGCLAESWMLSWRL